MKKVVRLTEQDLEIIVKKVLKEQSGEREFIMAVQEFLNDRYKKDPKFKPLSVDGKTGRNSKTEEAIMKYQDEKGLVSDGQIGPDTTEAMRKDGLARFEKRYKFLGLF